MLGMHYKEQEHASFSQSEKTYDSIVFQMLKPGKMSGSLTWQC
jgi:hypothetical protein